MFGALDIGGSKTIAAIMSIDGRIICRERFETSTGDMLVHMENCAISLDRLKESIGLDSLVGLGINVPGMVDFENGVLINAPFAGWKDIHVKEFFERRLKCAVLTDNDVNSCALGEMRFGYGPKYTDFIWVTVSNGVGGALVHDGKIVRGSSGFAGEIGHVKVEYDNPSRCCCGQYGCLEAYASGAAITKMTLLETERNPSFAARFEAEGLAPDAKSCAEFARKGVKEAMEIYRLAGMYLARGIAAAVNLVDPQAVIIGGGVSGSLSVMQNTITEYCKRYVVSQINGTDIVVTRLGYEAALYGALSLAIAAV